MAETRRALGVIRLSKMTDETTSPERQMEIIKAKARDRGAEVGNRWARDDDVSATKFPPHKRPELAKWLERHAEYDEIIFWRADRFVRKVRDLADMIDWSRKHGKGLVSATESFDLEDPTGQGEAMATMAALFAQMESKATSIRVTGTHAYLRESGRWPGGGIPYGYRVVRNPDGPGVVLAPDDVSSAIVREAVDRVLGGESVNAVAADFNRRGVLSPRDHARLMKGKARRCVCGHDKHSDGCGKCDCDQYTERHADWQRDSLKRVLRSEALLGRVLHEKQSVPGADGMPLIRAEKIIDADTFARVQRALDGAAKVKARTQTPSALLNVAFCACGQPFYKWSKPNKQGTVYSYYRCRNNYRRRDDSVRCSLRPVPCPILDDITSAALVDTIGWRHVMRLEVTPGDGHEKELAAVGQQIADLTAERYVRGVMRADFDPMMASLQAEHARLAALPPSPDVETLVPTGQKFHQKWDAMSTTERRLWLRDSGVRVSAVRGGGASPMDGYHERRTARGEGGGSLTASDVPRFILEERGDVHVMIELGSLAKLLSRAS